MYLIAYGLHRDDADNGIPYNLTSFVYLHGQLEEENKFDLVAIDEVPQEDGIYDIEVVLTTGSYKKGKLFFWHKDFMQRGLIVDNDDTEYLEDAQRKFDAKLAIL